MQFINNLPIGKKIFTIVIILGFAQILISAYAILKMNDIASEFDILYDIASPLEKLVTTTNKLQLQKSVALERLLRAAKGGAKRKVIKGHLQTLSNLTALNDKALQDILAILDHAESQPLQAALLEDIANLRLGTDEVIINQANHQKYVDGAVKIIKRGSFMAGGGFLTDEEQLKLEEIEVSLFERLATMEASIDNITNRAVDNAKEVQKSSLYQLIMIAVVFLIIGQLISKTIITNIVGPIKQLINTLTGMAQNNDLTKRMNFSSKDEVGAMSKTFNSFAEKLQSLVAGIAASSEQLSTAAEKTSVVSRSTNANMAQQKTETAQVALAITEMANKVEYVSANAEQANIAAQKGGSNSETGRQAVEEIVKSINSLANEINNSTDVIKKLKSDSVNIGTVLDVIKSIAEQTNLLALNAAIEAARAGEQGRGFAVVADEVRSLAQKTQDSTYEIESLISTLQNGSDNAVSSMAQNKKSIDGLVSQAVNATESLTAITQSVGSITEMNSLIADAAEQQSLVVKEVNTNVNNIQQGSENTAQSSEQVSQASQEIAELSENLKNMVNQFKIS